MVKCAGRAQTPCPHGWLTRRSTNGAIRPRTDPRYYETDNWLRQLGVSDERIDAVNREAAEEEIAVGRINADAR